MDMRPDEKMADKVRNVIEADGDKLTDLHLWRLGPGHIGAIVSVTTCEPRDAAYYRARLDRFEALSHVTIEIEKASVNRGSWEM